jgi:hypothetical protein
LVGELVLAVGNDQILLARDIDVVCVAIGIPQLMVLEAAYGARNTPRESRSIDGVVGLGWCVPTRLRRAYETSAAVHGVLYFEVHPHRTQA